MDYAEAIKQLAAKNIPVRDVRRCRLCTTRAVVSVGEFNLCPTHTISVAIAHKRELSRSDIHELYRDELLTGKKKRHPKPPKAPISMSVYRGRTFDWNGPENVISFKHKELNIG